MKFRVFGNRGFATCKLDLLALQDLFHLRNLVGRSVGRGARRNGGSSILRKSRSSPTRACLRLRAFAKGLTNESVEISADDGAGTLPRLDQTHQFKTANCVANGAAADLQHLRKFAFRGQFVAGL